jgi:hypothetical protein
MRRTVSGMFNAHEIDFAPSDVEIELRAVLATIERERDDHGS